MYKLVLVRSDIEQWRVSAEKFYRSQPHTAATNQKPSLPASRRHRTPLLKDLVPLFLPMAGFRMSSIPPILHPHRNKASNLNLESPLSFLAHLCPGSPDSRQTLLTTPTWDSDSARLDILEWSNTFDQHPFALSAQKPY